MTASVLPVAVARRLALAGLLALAPAAFAPDVLAGGSACPRRASPAELCRDALPAAAAGAAPARGVLCGRSDRDGDGPAGAAQDAGRRDDGRPENPRRDDSRRDDSRRDEGRREDGRARGGERDHREFWRSLSEAERAELHKLYLILKDRPKESRDRIFAHLRAMPAEDRLREIAKAREEVERQDAAWTSVLDRIGKEERRQHREFKLPEELTRLLEPVTDRDERRRIVREYFETHFREKRLEMLAELPATIRERVESLSPAEQTDFLRKYRGRESFLKIFAAPEARALVLAASPADIEVLIDGLARRVREEAARAAGGGPDAGAGAGAGAGTPVCPDKTSAGEAPAETRPECIHPEAWKSWSDLKTYERFRVLRTLVEMHLGEAGSDRDAGGRPDVRSEGGPRPRRGGPPRDGDERPEGRREGEGGGKR